MPLFVFKQKTAYDMRISDWSSDVCSSDLAVRGDVRRHVFHVARRVRRRWGCAAAAAGSGGALRLPCKRQQQQPAQSPNAASRPRSSAALVTPNHTTTPHHSASSCSPSHACASGGSLARGSASWTTADRKSTRLNSSH